MELVPSWYDQSMSSQENKKYKNVNYWPLLNILLYEFLYVTNLFHGTKSHEVITDLDKISTHYIMCSDYELS